LLEDEQVVWESLAIMEYLNEKYPAKKMWPADMAKRALARSISNEMHAGFTKMRQDLTFHAKRKFQNYNLKPAADDIARIKKIWDDNLKAHGGPFLFGEFSIADAMYAPVVGRFFTYSVPTEGRIEAYCKAIMALPAMKAWYTGAEKEDFIAASHEKT